MKGTRAMPKVMLRMDQDMKDRLTEAAERNFRSFNGEVLARLAASLEAENKEEKPATPTE